MSDLEMRAVAATVEALRRVDSPHSYESNERGYQGWFFAALLSTYSEVGLLRGGRTVEMEAQKAPGVHHTAVRPDIVVHVPRAPGSRVVNRGNFAVYELKMRASSRQARDDLTKLLEFKDLLAYRFAFFINIGVPAPGMHEWGQVCDPDVHAFSARLVEGGVEVTHEWDEGAEHDDEVETVGPGQDTEQWPTFRSLRRL